jgi:hypothetical protein
MGARQPTEPLPPPVPPALPGADLVGAGLTDLASGRESVESLLVALAATRLRRLGYPVPEAPSATDRPELRLYALLEAEVGPARAHGRYNALRRRLASFLRAAAGA